MLSLKQLREIQKIGEKMFVVYVDIYQRLPYAHDDSNPYGDDTVAFSPTRTRVKGWLVHGNAPTNMQVDGAQIISVEQSFVRVPFGTAVKPNDKVVINNDEYICVEATTEQSWPEWLDVRLKRIHH